MTTNNSWYGWEKVRRIGRGGYGEVYEIHRKIGSHTEKAALKLIRIPADSSEVETLRRNNYSIASITKRYEQQRDQIVQEYQMMQRLRGNPNIVQCNDIQIDPNPDGIGWQIGIRMELLTPLDRYLGKSITQQQVIDVGVQICNALIACKNNNIIHRDIKADNILVAEDGTVKLGDFGIAKVSEFTAPGTSIGTPGFEAPEVYNHREYGASADIYSLGLVLYWMLNERTKPFLPLPPQAPTALQEAEARERRYRGEPLPTPKNGSQQLKQVVLKAAAYQPHDRYAGARELQQALLAVSGSGSFYAGSTGTAGHTAYSRQQTTGGWESTAGGNTQSGYTSGGFTSGGYTSGGYTAGGNTVGNTQYSYTRGSGDNTFGNSWTERTQGQDRTSSGWTQPNTAAEKTAAASFYTQAKTEQRTPPKAAAAPARQYSSAVKKTPALKKFFRVFLLICVLAVGVGFVHMLIQEGVIQIDGGVAPIISGSVPGVEITDIPGDDSNTLILLGTFEGNAYIDESTGVYINTGTKIEGLSSQVHWTDYAYTDSMLNYLGQDTYGLSVIRSSNLGNDLLTVQKAANEINGIGLISFAGEVLLQPEAAIIDWPDYADDGRYLLVGYATEKASLGDDWQVALDEGYRRTKGYTDPEGTKYQGYTKVYDLVNKQFVPGIQLDNFDWYQAMNCGDYFAVLTEREEEYTNGVIVYNADGNVVASYDHISSISEFAIDVNGEYAGIYDYSGNLLFSDGDFYNHSLMDQYVMRYDWETENHVLMDLSGNVLMPWDDSYLWIHDNRIITADQDDINGLVTLDGEEILPCSYGFINYLGSGYFEASRKVAGDTYSHTIVGKNGVIAEDVKAYGYDLVYVENNRALVLNNRSFDLQLSEDGTWLEIGTALISYKDPQSELWCVYDLFTGNQLLPAEYSEIECINNKYLYAKKDGIWEVYEVQSTFISE